MAFSTSWAPQQQGIVLDGFAGPGGWSEGIRRYLGLHDVGLEWDDAACATRKAAGHDTIQTDVSQFDPATYIGLVWGLLMSPPCTLFSEGGTRIGRLVLDVLAEGIRRLMRGEDCRQEIRDRIYAVALPAQEQRNAKRSESKRRDSAEVQANAREDAFIASLVLEPARYLHELINAQSPAVPLEWAAFEQVPAVLPLWKVYAEELRRLGWSVWAGVLCAADYGVHQERYRAVLIASAVSAVAAPEPTHAQQDGGWDLFGGYRAPWLSMAECIGWGLSRRPSPTVTAGGAKSGGVEPFARGGREALRSAQLNGGWVWKPGPDRESTPSSIAINPVEAGLLQSFPADYQWAGTKGKAMEQAGNAVPPLLAAHVVSAATGIPVRHEQPASAAA
jgi:DNA (cytosine-5)-methyltransferase 1